MKRKKLTLKEISNIMNNAVSRYADDSPDNMIIRAKEKNYWEDIKHKTELFASIYDIKNILKKGNNVVFTSLYFKTNKKPTMTLIKNLRDYGFVYTKNKTKNNGQEYRFSCKIKN